MKFDNGKRYLDFFWLKTNKNNDNKETKLLEKDTTTEYPFIITNGTIIPEKKHLIIKKKTILKVLGRRCFRKKTGCQKREKKKSTR